MDATPLAAALVLLALSMVAVTLVRRVHLPPILGYLLVGIIALPHALGWIPEGDIGIALGIALFKGIVTIVAMLIAGRWLSRPLFRWVAAAHSVELLTLAVLLIPLTAAWVTHAVGLSLALGAFIAGILIGDTEYRHHVETEVRPFRDVLMGLFFITVGMQLDIAALPPSCIGWSCCYLDWSSARIC